jgi:hypothetical protein
VRKGLDEREGQKHATFWTDAPGQDFTLNLYPEISISEPYSFSARRNRDLKTKPVLDWMEVVHEYRQALCLYSLIGLRKGCAKAWARCQQAISSILSNSVSLPGLPSISDCSRSRLTCKPGRGRHPVRSEVTLPIFLRETHETEFSPNREILLSPMVYV